MAVDVRRMLQDDDGVRYTNADLASEFTHAVQRLRYMRPDAFLGMYGTDLPEYDETNITGAVGISFPVDSQFVTPVVDYVVGRLELRDDEFVNDGRAATLLQNFSIAVLRGTI